MVDLFVAQTETGTGSGEDINNIAAITSYNSATGFFADLSGDTVYLIDTITSQVNVRPGSDGNPHVLRGDYPGRNGVVDVAGVTSRSVYAGSADYTSVLNLTIEGGSLQGMYASACTDLIISGCSISGPTGLYTANCNSLTLSNNNYVSETGTAYAARINSGDSVTITDDTVNSSTGFGYYIDGYTTININGLDVSDCQYAGVWVSCETNTAITATNISVDLCGQAGAGSQYSLWIDGADATGLTGDFDNITITNANERGVFVDTGTWTSASITNLNVTGSGGDGLYVSLVSGWVFDGCTLLNNTASGARFETATGCILQNSDIGNSGVDGVTFNTNSSGNTVRGCKVYGAGQTDATSNGDGITAHAGCTNLKIYLNAVYDNKNSGFAFVGDASGYVYFNSVWGNGDSASTNMGVRGGYYSTSTGAWDVQQNIYVGNYPYEVQTNSDGATGLTADYNHYLPLDDATFANLGAGAISWTTYSTNESNSVNEDPLILSSGKILNTSPCVNVASVLTEFITEVFWSTAPDPWGKYVYKSFNRGADQGAGTPDGSNTQLIIGGGSRVGQGILIF